MNRAAFYAALRRRSSGVFGTSISRQRVRGVEGILDAFATHGDGRAKTLAYALATAYHETGRKMVPVREGFKKSDAEARRYVQRNYGHKGKDWYCWPQGPYGHVYYGRGQVQLTWLDNYRRSSADAGVDLVKDPDKALDPVIGARILIRGLLDGRWNGKGFGIRHYLPDAGDDDLRNARRTVNITDKWDLIAGYYRSFLAVIKEAGGVPKGPLEDVRIPEPEPKPKSTEDAEAVSPTSSSGGLAALVKRLTSIFGGKR
ncbi:glycoside hydrolase family 19 protein [Nitratireductor sp. XY-223]|uniref:glycoside hydrolase family 19 protein n=1 Tax=Nitratireductor sp. XY-223 TaxID=2561926 RepID=UPI0010AAEBD7|nr:glycoside hydrolase family 19 protein [Nitratireductor sp. XY-223]